MLWNLANGYNKKGKTVAPISLETAERATGARLCFRQNVRHIAKQWYSDSANYACKIRPGTRFTWNIEKKIKPSPSVSCGNEGKQKSIVRPSVTKSIKDWCQRNIDAINEAFLSLLFWGIVFLSKCWLWYIIYFI